MKNLNSENIKEKVQEIHNFDKDISSYPISVVIVSYNGNEKLARCLDSLKNQTEEKFELIVVDNGKNNRINFKNYNLKYIKLKKNYGLSEGRNIGIYYSKSEIVSFLDDDLIADSNLISSHLRAYTERNIIGLRGKVKPISNSIYNKLQSHYDLGDSVIPSFIDAEGNCSFKRCILQNIGGFNSTLYGHEGIELSYRIIKKYKDRDKLIYYPDAIVFHDYSDSFLKYIKKQIRHKNIWKNLSNDYPELPNFLKQYERSNTNNLVLSKWDKIRIKFISKATYYILRLDDKLNKRN